MTVVHLQDYDPPFPIFILMKKSQSLKLFLPLFSVAIISLIFVLNVRAEHPFNGPYTGRNLEQIAFPIGGLGAGMYCLEGNGSLTSVSVNHGMEFYKAPACFAAVCVLGDSPEKNEALLLEGPLSEWKYFGREWSGLGSGGTTYGFPRFRDCTFDFRFPFATIDLKDDSFPIKAEILGWSPFTPGDPDTSGYPLGVLEYKLTNTTDKTQKAIFTFNTPNFMNGGGSIGPMEDGLVLYSETGDKRGESSSFAFFIQGEAGKKLSNVKIDHCWFRGGWFDALTIVWDNVIKGRTVDNPPVASNAPGGTIACPFELKPNETQVVRLMTVWYSPKSNLSVGGGAQKGPAFGNGPATGTARGQQPVSGYLGKKLVNSYFPNSDGGTGTLTSPKITLNKKFIHFLIGGGSSCPAQLLVDGKVVRSAAGQNEESLNWTTWDVAEFAGKEAQIKLVDEQTGGWGHINADHFVMSDEPINALKTGQGNEILTDPGKVVLIADFEGADFKDWTDRKSVV